MSFGTRGCRVAMIMAVLFTATGTALLQIYGPTFCVYFLSGKTSKERGSKHPGSYREYIGITEQHPEERHQEHMTRANKKGATWLQFVETEGKPIVLYKTEDEHKALKVELNRFLSPGLAQMFGEVCK